MIIAPISLAVVACAKGGLPLPIARVVQLAEEHFGVRLITDVDYDFDRLLLGDFFPRKTSHNHSHLSPHSVGVRKFNPFIISHRAFTVDDIEEVSGHASPFVSIKGAKPLFTKIVPDLTSIGPVDNIGESGD